MSFSFFFFFPFFNYVLFFFKTWRTKSIQNAPALPGETATVVVDGPPWRNPLLVTAAPADAAAPEPFSFLLFLPVPPAAVDTAEAPPLEAPPAAAPGAAPAAVEDCPAAELPVATFPFVAVLLVEVAAPPPLPPPPPLPLMPPPPLLPLAPAVAAPAGRSLLMASRAPLASRERVVEVEKVKAEEGRAVAAVAVGNEEVAATAAKTTATTAAVRKTAGEPRAPQQQVFADLVWGIPVKHKIV